MSLIKADQSETFRHDLALKLDFKKLSLEEAHVWGICSLRSSSLGTINFFTANMAFVNKRHETNLATLELVTKVLQSIDNNNYTTGVFLELSKAFDTVDHQFFKKA